jgi:heterodisulfide reductase subunit A-like polyferredoxin
MHSSWLAVRSSIAMRHRRSSTSVLQFSSVLTASVRVHCVYSEYNKHHQQLIMRITKSLLRQAHHASRQRFEYRGPDFEVDHLVVGGGVIGLACAAKLTTALPKKTTYLVERHSQVCALV